MNVIRRKLLKNLGLIAMGTGVWLSSGRGRGVAAAANAPGYDVPSRFVNVLGSKMHYVEMGEGDPIVMIHGNPTSSYLWRNIAPRLAELGRVIVPDMIGMGLSDKPDIDYRLRDHIRYFDAFFDKLRLRNVTFVGHDWGSSIAFHYAMRNESSIKGLAFMEGFVKPLSWDEWPEGARDLFRKIRTRDEGWDLIVNQNYFIEGILPWAIIRKLTWQELDAYRAPYLRPETRKPLWVWPNELPLGGEPLDVVATVEQYSAWLRRTQKPKLLLYAEPGALVPTPMVRWCLQNLPNLRAENIGPGIHFVQEDNPAGIAFHLANWIRELDQRDGA
jgi:haloalkane dehalogenase